MSVDRITQTLSKAVQLHRSGKLDQAAPIYNELRLLAPRHFDVWHLSGTLSLQLGRPTEAVTFLGQAHQLNPRDLVCLMRLALAELQMGQTRLAITRLEKVIKQKPDFAEAWDNLGMARKMSGDLEGAIAAQRRAVQMNPKYVQGWCNLGHSLIMQGQIVESLAAQDQALKLDPKFGNAHFGRGVALQALHRIPEAIHAYEEQLILEPQHFEARSYRLMALHYLDNVPPAALADQHRRYGAQFPAVPPRPAPHKVNGKVRIGFVSPDFRHHAVASFFEPLLNALSPARCEVVLYHDHFITDTVSHRLREKAFLWRPIIGQPNPAVEKVMRADQLDVLVDLTGHTGLNRLPLFARRVAAVQATYLGYPNTTGLSSIDLRFTDAYADPEGEADTLHAEKLVRLSPCAWVWQPPADSPDVPPPPSQINGYITFGSFNNAAKLSPGTLKLWAAVLQAVPNSRLFLKSSGLENPGIAEPLKARCAAAGLPMDRVTLQGYLPDARSHLAAYSQIDIALDPFPYHGTTTTCEALWMGRPVVTLAGDRHSSRVGVSLLHAVGHSTWIAGDHESYVKLATELAADPSLLVAVAIQLRDDVAKSPLRQPGVLAESFVNALEAELALLGPAVTAA